MGFKCSIFPDDLHKDVDTSESIQRVRLVSRENFFTGRMVRLPREVMEPIFGSAEKVCGYDIWK